MKSLSIFRAVWDWPPPWIGLSPGPYDLTVAQQKIGNTLTVATGGWPLKKKESIPGVELIRLPSGLPLWNESIFLSTAPAALLFYIWKRLTSHIHIIHCHGHLSFFFSLYKGLFGWLDRTPLVVHLHHISVVRYARVKEQYNGKPPFFMRAGWFLQRLNERLAVRFATAIVVVSESMRDELAAHYIDVDKKVTVLSNGVSADLFTLEGERAHIPGDFDKKVLFVGILNQRKNPDLLIRALEFLPDEYGIVLVGPDTMQGTLQALVEEMRLEKRVIFMGEIHNRELGSYLRSATVMALPSSSEGFPKVVLESLACGVPVAASGFTVSDEFDAGIEYIDDLQPRAVADAILRAEKKKETVSSNLVRDKYSWVARANELQKLYDSLLKTTHS